MVPRKKARLNHVSFNAHHPILIVGDSRFVSEHLFFSLATFHVELQKIAERIVIDYYCRTRPTDKTPHSVLEKMKEAENFSYAMNFGHFSIQVGISPSEVISAQKMKWAVKL